MEVQVKNAFKILILFILFSSSTYLTGCGGDDNKNPMGPNLLVGTWKLINCNMIQGGITFTATGNLVLTETRFTLLFITKSDDPNYSFSNSTAGIYTVDGQQAGTQGGTEITLVDDRSGNIIQLLVNRRGDRIIFRNPAQLTIDCVFVKQ